MEKNEEKKNEIIAIENDISVYKSKEAERDAILVKYKDLVVTRENLTESKLAKRSVVDYYRIMQSLEKKINDTLNKMKKFNKTEFESHIEEVLKLKDRLTAEINVLEAEKKAEIKAKKEAKEKKLAGLHSDLEVIKKESFDAINSTNTIAGVDKLDLEIDLDHYKDVKEDAKYTAYEIKRRVTERKKEIERELKSLEEEAEIKAKKEALRKDAEELEKKRLEQEAKEKEINDKLAKLFPAEPEEKKEKEIETLSETLTPETEEEKNEPKKEIPEVSAEPEETEIVDNLELIICLPGREEPIYRDELTRDEYCKIVGYIDKIRTIAKLNK